MTTPISGIPNTRVSDSFIRARMLNQVQFDQAALYKTQSQISSGKRFQTPSEDPIAAMRVMSLQRLLQRNAQMASNQTTSGSYLSATDTAISGVSNLTTDLRALTVGVMGTTASDEQRQSASQQADQILTQLLDTGNQQFGGRYLFAGSENGLQPFDLAANRIVEYSGNEEHLSSYADINQLFNINLTGSQVFGAISEPVRGTADLNPVLTFDTPLANLRGGQGISRGSISLSDGNNTSIVDLSKAQTVGDLARMITRNSPPNRAVEVDIEANTLVIRLAPTMGVTNFSIREVGGGTTAAELGILRVNGVGALPIESRDLNPKLTATTSLDDILGAHARAAVHSQGADSDFLVEADVPGGRSAPLPAGVELNGVTVTLVDDPTVSAGHEVVHYDPVAKQIVVDIDGGRSKASDVVAAINAQHDSVLFPFQARLDPIDELNDGAGLVSAGASGTTRDGAGEKFDQTAGLQIVNRNETTTVSLQLATTVEDVLNMLNGSGAGLLAEVNESGTGIDVRSRVSGCDFAIGENGGQTATQLGLRTFTRDTQLAGLNFGRGVDDYPGYNNGLAQGAFPSSLANSDLLFRASNKGADWNGFAISVSETVSQSAFPSAAANSDLLFRARNTGDDWNGFTLTVSNTLGPEQVLYNRAGKTLDIQVHAGATASHVADLLRNAPGAGDDWEAVLDNLPNSGAGAVDVGTVTSAMGPEQVVYDRAGKTMDIQVHAGATAKRVAELLHNDPTAGKDWEAVLDNPPNSGEGVVDVGRVTTAADGADFYITRTDGVRLAVDIHGQETIGDVIDLINNLPENTGSSLRAQLNDFGNGIELIDRTLAGGQLRITINPMSKAASDLGLIPAGTTGSPPATLTGSPAATVSSAAIKSGLIFSAKTGGNAYNGVRVIFDPAPATPLGPAYDPALRTLTFGVSTGPTAAAIKAALDGSPLSSQFAAEFNPADNSHNDGSGQVAPSAGNILTCGADNHSTVTVKFPGTDNDLTIRTLAAFPAQDGTDVQFVAGPVGPPAVTISHMGNVLRVTYDAVTGTTAQQVVAAFAGDPAFAATLDPQDYSDNHGEGVVSANAPLGVTMTGGSQTITGTDSNPLETESIYTAVIRIRDGLLTNNQYQVQRSVDQLDRKVTDMLYARSELDAEQQGLDVLQARQSTDNIELENVLSLEYDADLASVISEFSARQASFEASLRASAMISQLTLLNFL